MKTFAALITVLVLALAAAACGSGNDDKGDKPPATDGPTVDDSSLVTYTVANGLARTERSVDVRNDGTARVVYDGRATEFSLTEKELLDLQLAMRDVNFLSLEDRYEQTEEVHDSSVITLTSQGKEVTVLLPADPPDELQHLIDLLSAQLEKHEDDAKQGPTEIEGRPVVPSPSDNLIAYTRTGGVGGISEKLFVRLDGAARLEINGEVHKFKLPDDELNDLRYLIDRADFEDFFPEYGDPPVADGFVDTITAEGHTVKLNDPDDAPLGLRNLLMQVNVYVARYR